MDIYHSTYVQYIAQMNLLKGCVAEVVAQAVKDLQKKEEALGILSQIDESIYTASAETFLPSGELLNITRALVALKERLHTPTPATLALFKPCFKTLQTAATVLKKITDDRSLEEASELSAREMY